MATRAPAETRELPPVVRDALEWERHQWTDGDVSDPDSFYVAPPDSSNAMPGALLKVEEATDTSKYTIPPMTALSRFIYQSQTLNGTPVPVSGFILWPFSPRSSANGYQVVAWAHGTSGITPNTAPSHHKNLWQHYFAPFNLALHGYVVVATDYAGIGVGKTASGQPILHEYLASPAHANDVFYSVQAAREAFPQLGKQFVVFGHSQGGAAAWSAAQRQLTRGAVDGYLGAVACAPVTSIMEDAEPLRSVMQTGVLPGIATYFPDFNMSDVATEKGLELLKLIRAAELPVSSIIALTSTSQLLKKDWMENTHVRSYQDIIRNGGQAIDKPLLIIKGEGDRSLQYSILAAAVKDTMEKFPKAQIEFLHMPGVFHDPSMTASQRYRMDWIADRFAGRDAGVGSKELQVNGARPINAYLLEPNSYLASATKYYQTL